MPSYEEVKDALKGLDGVSSFFGKSEIKELPNILWENELPEAVVQGRYGNRTGILTCTNNRLIFVSKTLGISLRVEDFPLDKISSLQYETGMIFGKITVFASGNKADIDQIDKKQARNFAEFVRSKISKLNSSGKTTSSEPETEASLQKDSTDIMIEKLERLGALKDKGIISEDEFQAQKEKILNM